MTCQASPKTLPTPPLPHDGDAWSVFLDVDGTLLDFANDPDAVQVPAALLDTLDELHEALNGALALISGRAIGTIDFLFGRPAWPAAGLHGLERRGADGHVQRGTDHAARPLDLRHAADAVAAQMPGVRVEDKGACIALHCRQAPQLEAALAAAAAALAHRLDGYEVQRGNHVFELKPMGADKGEAVCAFLREVPFCGRTPVYVGDDLTDEHGFAVVNARRGISIRVGHRVPSKALFTLDNVAAVHTWLRACLHALRPESS